MSTTFLHRALASAILLTATTAGAAPVLGHHAAQGTEVGNAAASTCSASDLGGLAGDCRGYVNVRDDGNVSNAGLIELAGTELWHGLDLGTLARYKDGSAGAGSNQVLFDLQRSADDPSQGQLKFLMNLAGPFVLTLKAGDAWAAYFLADGATAGSTILVDIPGDDRRLSQAAVYTATAPTPSTDLPPPNQSVPEPATAALVLLALGAVGSSRWHARRRLPQA